VAELKTNALESNSIAISFTGTNLLVSVHRAARKEELQELNVQFLIYLIYKITKIE
jgi:hypothetical protein